jgi:hypothetical protein
LEACLSGLTVLSDFFLLVLFCMVGGNSTSDTECDSDTQSSPPIQTTIGNNDKPYVTFKDKQKRKAVSGEAKASKELPLPS